MSLIRQDQLNHDHTTDLTKRIIDAIANKQDIFHEEVLKEIRVSRFDRPSRT